VSALANMATRRGLQAGPQALNMRPAQRRPHPELRTSATKFRLRARGDGPARANRRCGSVQPH
jgi:hypothetical protein